MLRSVHLPGRVPGALRLHRMPGWREALATVWRDVESEGIQRIVCLAPLEEIRDKSAAYAAALEANALPCAVEHFPVPDYGVPADRDAFWSLASRIARRLQRGERVLIHCGAGIGRTGTLAVCVLLALGMSRTEAEHAVTVAGSAPETLEQRNLVFWFASRWPAGV